MMNENNEAVTVSDSQMPKLITVNPLAEEEKQPVVPKRREVQGLGFIAPQKAKAVSGQQHIHIVD